MGKKPSKQPKKKKKKRKSYLYTRNQNVIRLAQKIPLNSKTHKLDLWLGFPSTSLGACEIEPPKESE